MKSEEILNLAVWFYAATGCPTNISGRPLEIKYPAEGFAVLCGFYLDSEALCDFCQKGGNEAFCRVLCQGMNDRYGHQDVAMAYFK
jgi:hypothetical protein